MVERCILDGRAVTFVRHPGDGPTLVCVHGAPENHHTFDLLFDALPGVARVAVDSPGRLGSDGPPMGSVAELEDFIRRFVDSEVAGDYVLLGHSLGGGVAIEHALVSATPRLRGLVLVSTGARLRVHPAIQSIYAQAAATGEPPPVSSSSFEEAVDPELMARVIKGIQLTPVESGVVDWRAADGFDRMQDVARIETPTLVIGGSEDALTPPKYGDYLTEKIRQSERVLIAGGAHMLIAERAQEVAGAIASFVARLGSAA